MQKTSSRASKQSSEIPINLPSQNTTFDHVAGEYKKNNNILLLTWTKYDRVQDVKLFGLMLEGRRNWAIGKIWKHLIPKNKHKQGKIGKRFAEINKR